MKYLKGTSLLLLAKKTGILSLEVISKYPDSFRNNIYFSKNIIGYGNHQLSFFLIFCIASHHVLYFKQFNDSLFQSMSYRSSPSIQLRPCKILHYILSSTGSLPWLSLPSLHSQVLHAKHCKLLHFQ